MNNLRILLLLLAMSMLFLQGNSAPPWFACQGKQVGDLCRYGPLAACHGSTGECKLSDHYTDNPDTPDLNEQLICVNR